MERSVGWAPALANDPRGAYAYLATIRPGDRTAVHSPTARPTRTCWDGCVNVPPVSGWPI